MNTIELFAGTKSFSKVMKKHGHATFTIDNQDALKPDLVADILKVKRLPFKPDVMWASPPCTAFSVASIGHHWGGGARAYEPKTPEAELGIALVKKTLRLIEQTKPTWWFIENPRGVLRNLPFMDRAMKKMGGVRHTVWYCRYGDNRAKPTDIWTNATWWNPREMCHNRRPNHASDCGCTDHEAAPRGAKTGTQGIDGARDRGRIPPALFREILRQMP